MGKQNANGGHINDDVIGLAILSCYAGNPALRYFIHPGLGARHASYHHPPAYCHLPVSFFS